jgi:hypothetical protein
MLPLRTSLPRRAWRAAWAAMPLLLAAACATVPRPTPISTSRLGVAKATGTVARGVVQLEAGYSRGHQDGRTRETFGETLLRVGMGPRTEARIGLPSYLRTATPAATVEGLGDPALVVKHRLHDLAGGLPAVAVTLGSSIPVGADGVGAGGFQPEAGLSTEWKLPAGFRALALGSFRDAVAAGDRFGLTTLAAGARRALSDRTLAQAEYIHVASTRAGAADVNQLRAGAALRVTPSLQLDGWAARSTAAGVHEFLFGVGFARRW